MQSIYRVHVTPGSIKYIKRMYRRVGVLAEVSLVPLCPEGEGRTHNVGCVCVSDSLVTTTDYMSDKRRTDLHKEATNVSSIKELTTNRST